MRALYANTTGTENVAAGYLSLDANTTGNYNVAYGVNSLGSNTTANYNTAIGTQAMIANTTGTDNVAVGAFALDANTTASGNTAVGYASLTTCTTGANNTAVGQAAGQDLTGGVANTLIGQNAGGNITTGVENTCLGQNAGDAITSSSQNICIGHGTDPGNSTGHAINIGYDIGIDGNFFAFGKASNIVYNGFTSNASWTRSSDIRLKKNIATNTLGLDFINTLRPVTYNWKDSREIDSSDSELTDHYDASENRMDSTTTFHGFIAQEVKTAIDNAGVSNFGAWNKLSNGVQGVSLEAMVTPLVTALQEADDKIEALTARIVALES